MRHSASTSRSRLGPLGLLVVLAAPAGCSAAAAPDDTGTGGSDAAGATFGAGAGAPSGPTSGTASGEPTAPLGAAPGVSISEIALYQTLKVELAEGGQPASPALPILAGKDALVRVFVATDGAYDGGAVAANLWIEDGDAPIAATLETAAASAEEDITTTLNFRIEGARIAAGMSYRIELGRASAPGTPTTFGPSPVTIDASNTTLKIKLVPIAYGADGSGRLPDLSDAQLARYKDRFYALYPTSNVELTVREAVTYDAPVQNNGGGWQELLAALASLRESDATPPDVYYYGIFDPTANHAGFCSGGCVLGLGMNGTSPTDTYSRAAIGLGFTGDEAADTIVHEIGHTHGRYHSPCQTPDPDPAFPYPGGKSGVWGYDLPKDVLRMPTTPDMMGYCIPYAISDYTYRALADRIGFLNGAAVHYPPETLDRTYERVAVGADGELTWLPPIQLRTPPLAEPTEVRVEAAGISEPIEGALFSYDHLPGGVLLAPRPLGIEPTALSVVRAGKKWRISR